jgi:hypothetical protein
VSVSPERADYTALSDRMSHLLALRFAIAALVVAWSSVRPEVLGVTFGDLAGLTLGYLGLALLVELARRRSTSHRHAFLSLILIVDGLYLAYAMYATGGTQSPIRFLIYLHLVAVSLLAPTEPG